MLPPPHLDPHSIAALAQIAETAASNATPSWLPTVITAVIAAGAAWLTARTWKPGGRENALIDQMQEELSSLRSETQSLRSEIGALRLAQDATDRKLRRMTAYAVRLHADSIRQGLEPEPWPEDL